jgi:hypothetical protein
VGERTDSDATFGQSGSILTACFITQISVILFWS